MAKVRTDKGGNRYVAHEEALAEDMANPAFREAYKQRRYVHEFGRAVRAMREAAGLSQNELAARVGMKQPAIARIETSQGSAPQWRTLDRIAFALGRQLKLNLGAVDTDKPIVRIEPLPRRHREEHSAKYNSPKHTRG
jgi:HTH-type transcriptional regulator / antitoxin HipB